MQDKAGHCITYVQYEVALHDAAQYMPALLLFSMAPSPRCWPAATPVLVLVLALAGIRGADATCTSALSCSLNGECTGGSCECAAGWHGEECELLRSSGADV